MFLYMYVKCPQKVVIHFKYSCVFPILVAPSYLSSLIMTVQTFMCVKSYLCWNAWDTWQFFMDNMF